MTTKEFITKAFNGQTRKKHCASVFADSEGNIYSYGSHYPLLFRVNGKAIRNVTGYSNTTARHIQWSRGVEAIDIHAGLGFRLRGTNQDILEALIDGQMDHINDLKEQMNAKKRKDTQVYKWLKFNHDRACDNLAKLRGQI